MEHIEYKKIASRIRMDVIEEVHSAGSGHPGGSLSAADIVTALYFGEMNIDPKNPQMKGRDKFVLSKGHAAPVQYAALAEKGYFPKEELTTLRKLGSRLQGHPNMHKLPGIEMSTGSLGQGLSIACGMAISLKLDKNPAHVFALMGDGELQEGNVWEAFMQAPQRGLDNLIIIIDRNRLQIDGCTENIKALDPLDEKIKAFNWDVIEINGHNIVEIFDAIEKAKSNKKPTAIIADTIKGKGVSFMENNAGWHGKAPNKEEYEKAIAEIAR